jgi:hypothetical protein
MQQAQGAGATLRCASAADSQERAPTALRNVVLAVGRLAGTHLVSDAAPSGSTEQGGARVDLHSTDEPATQRQAGASRGPRTEETGSSTGGARAEGGWPSSTGGARAEGGWAARRHGPRRT